MISGPYHIGIVRLSRGWYVMEHADTYTEWGPYRWQWLARLVMAWVRDDA